MTQTSSPPTASPWRDVLPLAGIALAYFFAFQIAFLFPAASQVLADIWPASGIGLAALLLNPRRRWPAIGVTLFVAGSTAHLLVGNSLATSLGLMTANVLESLACAALIQRWRGPRLTFTHVSDVTALLGAATLVNAVTALGGAGIAALTTGAPFWGFWATWWVADGLGLLLVTPLILTWSTLPLSRLRHPNPRLALEVVLFTLLWAAAAWGSFQPFSGRYILTPRPYLLIVLLAWPAVRLGQRWVTVAMTLLAVITITSPAVTVGPLPWGGTNAFERLLLSQIFLAAITLTGLLLAAAYAEAKAAERASREDQARLRALGDNLPDGAIFQVMVTPEGKDGFIYVSAGVELVTGLSAETLLRDGRTFFNLITEDARPAFVAAQRASAQSLTPLRIVTRLRRPDGQVRWIQVAASPRRLPAGELVWDGILLDVTERQQAEEARQASQARFREALEFLPIPIGLADQQGHILFYNREFTRRYGYTHDDVPTIEAWMQQAYPDPAYRAMVLALWHEDQRHIIADPTSSPPREFTVTCKDGSTRQVEVEVRPSGDAFLSAFVDVTERRQAEEAVRHLNTSLEERVAARTAELTQANQHLEAEIAERRRVEQALQAQTQLLNLTGETAHVGGWEFDPQTMRGQGTAEAARIYDLDPTVGASLEQGMQFYLNPHRQALESAIREAVELAKPYNLELELVTAKGVHKWVRAIGRPILEDGRVVKVYGSLQDITERRRTDQALQAQAQLLTLTGQTAHVGGWEFDPQTMAAIWTDEALRIHDFDPVDMPNVPQSLDCYQGVHRERIENAVREAVAQAQPYDLELEMVTAQGNHKWVRIIGQPVMEGGRVVKVYGSLQDITERRQAEQALQNQADLLALTGETAHVGGWEIDPQTWTSTGTPETARIYDLDPALGVTPAQGINAHPAPYRQMLEHAFRQAVDLAQPYDLELQVVTAQGNHKWVRAIGQPVVEGGRVVKVYGSLQDITERVQAEAEIRQLNTRLEQRVSERTEQLETANRELRGEIAARRRVEEALREAQQRYQLIYENAIDGIFQSTTEGRYLRVNPAMARIFGYASPEAMVAAVGNQIVSRIHVSPNSRAEFMRRLNQEGQLFDFEAQNYRQDGRIIWTRTSARTVRDAAGAVAYYEGFLEDITERKTAERLKAETAYYYRQVVDHSGVGIVALDETERYVLVNTTAAKRMNTTPEAIVGRSPREVLASGENERVAASRREVMATGEGQEYEATLDLPTGTRTFHISDQPITDLEGRRTGIISSSIDITARKRIEEALRASEKKYRQLSESLMDAYAAVDMDGWIVEFNEAFAAMIGYSPGAVRQLTYEAITPEAWHAFEANILQRQVLVRGYSDIYQKEYRRRDGTVFPVELRTNLIRDEAGNPTGMWAVIRDITPQKQAEAALREASERLELTQKAAGAGAWDWNLLTGQLTWSPEMFVLLGLDPQAGASFDTWRAAMHPDDRAPAELRITEALEAHRRLENQYRVVWPADGQVHWISAIGQGVYDDQGAPLRMSGICLDVTAQKQAEETQRASEARLRETAEENARLLALSRKDALTQATLLHEVNHRVKNNLAAIIGLLYLEQRYRPAGNQAPYETLVHDLTGRIQSLAVVHDLLSAGAWAPLPLAQLAERVLQGALALMPLQSHVQVTVRPSPVQLASKQASALGLILNELATNALKHAAPPACGLYLILDIAQAAGHVRLEFSDNGPGFPTDVLDGSRQNIGLHLIHNLTEHDLGGTLALSNRRGAVVRLTFPAAPAEPGAGSAREGQHV